MRAGLPGAAALVLVVVSGCGMAPQKAEAPPAIDLDGALGEQRGDADFLKIDGPPQLVFPSDHGPHPDYRQEWWYLTGNLDAPDGRRFGYQATVFRFALGREVSDAADPGASTAEQSRWRSSQLYMAHLALTDVDGGRFLARDRFARNALGLAGAQASPLAVWVEDWQISALPSPAQGAADDPVPFALHVEMADEAFAVELDLNALRPVVPQGIDGYSRKGDDITNASAYYSIPRLATRGHVRLGDERVAVTGTSWLDREWGTSFLAAGVAGWDWFSLHLDDGRDLMFYRLRTDSGEATRHSAGTIIRGGDEWVPLDIQRLTADDVALTPLSWWRSPKTGVRYPVSWQLSVPEFGLELRVDASLEDQELRLATRYWEGAVDVRGTTDGAPVTGRGYLELAGYTPSR